MALVRCSGVDRRFFAFAWFPHPGICIHPIPPFHFLTVVAGHTFSREHWRDFAGGKKLIDAGSTPDEFHGMAAASQVMRIRLIENSEQCPVIEEGNVDGWGIRYFKAFRKATRSLISCFVSC